MKIALVGRGKMGKAVERLALARGWEITCMCGADRPLDQEALAAADVVVEFTSPEAALGNIERILSWKKNLVVGTTGWTSRIEEVRKWVRQAGCGMVYGANFSIGMNLVFRLCEQAGKLFQEAGFSPFIFEAHHSAKKDAPSGTAGELAARLRRGPSGQEISISSLRAGSFPGTHLVGFDSKFETVTLKHEVRDRDVFAEGALHAAQWVAGKEGLFKFEETL